MQRTDEYSIRLKHQIENKTSLKRIALTEISSRVNELNPAHKIVRQIEKVGHLQSQFKKSIKIILDKANHETSRLSHMLETVSPISTLERGYAIVTDTKTNSIVTNTSELRSGDQLRIRLSKAEIDSTIDKIYEK